MKVLTCKECGSFTIDYETRLCVSCSLVKFIENIYKLDVENIDFEGGKNE